MATVQITHDDVDHSVTTGVRTVQLGLDGRTVEVDLGEPNREKLLEFLTPFLRAGRKVAAASEDKIVRPAKRGPEPKNGTPKLGGDKASAPRGDRAAMAAYNEKVRAWAAETGIELNPRGRIPNEVKEQYEAAHQALVLVG